MADSHLVLITGGSRSGKSTCAMKLAEPAAVNGGAFFVATAQASDDEMRTRIARHRRERSAAFATIEEPLEVCEAVAGLVHPRVLVIDCLTIWISNLMAAGRGDDEIMAQVETLAGLLRAASFDAFVVTDEVGSGLVPMDPVGRRFRDLLGWANQIIGRAAGRILLMVAGYPLRVK